MMKSVCLTLSAFLFQSAAFATFTDPRPFDKNPPPGLEVSTYKKGAEAVLGLEFTKENRGNMFGSGISEIYQGCSATFVSNDGYVLTALHCLQFCSVEKIEKTGNIITTTSEADAIEKGQVYCQIEFANFHHSLPTVSAQVIAAGIGINSSPDVKSFSEQDAQTVAALLQQGYRNSEDYAVLKVPLKKHGCVEVASPSVGEKVWSIGWPTKTDRQGNGNAPGEAPMFSSGAIGTIFPETSLRLENKAAVFNSYVNAPGMFKSSVDAVSGSSGSGILNSEGQLVGLTVRVGTPLDSTRADMLRFENPGETYSISIDKIKSEMRKRYGAGLVNEVFSCR